MGRKPTASKLSEKLLKHDSTNPNVEPENDNPSLEKVDKLPEIANPIPQSPETNPSGASPRKRGKKTPGRKVRRSERLSNAFMTRDDQDAHRLIQEITVSESDRDDESAEEKLPEPTLNEKGLEEKLEYMVQLLETQEKTINELNSKVTGKPIFNESSSTGEITYKSLYLNSQQKIEDLTAENNQLHRKLERALGKIEVYENGNHILTEVLEKFKDVFRDTCWLSSLAKSPEATVERCLECMTSAKRKRYDRETEKN